MSKRLFVATFVVDEERLEETKHTPDSKDTRAKIADLIRGLSTGVGTGVQLRTLSDGLEDFVDDFLGDLETSARPGEGRRTIPQRSAAAEIRRALMIARDYIADAVDEQHSGLAEGLYDDGEALRERELHLSEFDRSLQLIAALLGPSTKLDAP